MLRLRIENMDNRGYHKVKCLYFVMWLHRINQLFIHKVVLGGQSSNVS